MSLEDPTTAIDLAYNVRNLIALLTVIVLTFSVYFAKTSAKHAKETQRTQLFLSLRDRYLEIRLKIPTAVYGEGYVLNDSDQTWMSVEQYWYNAFDEWYSTNKLNQGHFKDLWIAYFGPAIQFTLKSPAMVKVLDRMLAGGVSFGAQKDPFKDALRVLYKDLGASERAASTTLDKS